MKSSPEYFQIFSNFYVIMFMILVVIILISMNIITTPLGKVLVLFFGKSGDNDILSDDTRIIEGSDSNGKRRGTPIPKICQNKKSSNI